MKTFEKYLQLAWDDNVEVKKDVRRESSQECGVDDMVMLDEVDMMAFVANIYIRYLKGRIYTYIGEVLVSVNPYRSMMIYEEEYVKRYRNREMYENTPHIFAVADAAFTSVCQRGRDACVVISGESGSGKTEASKVMLKYFASVTAHHTHVEKIKNILLQSNCILEAFGNAKTNRNDNSSRFGKYMEILFDLSGDPVGGRLNNYLLEKSRVVTQQEGERNFHAFYQLLQGCHETKLNEFSLVKDPGKYRYLSTFPAKVSSINDRSDYRSVDGALKNIGLQAHSALLWKLLAVVLHLGNMEIQEQGGVCTVPASSLDVVSSLLMVTAQQMEEAMSGRVVAAKGEVVTKKHSLQDAVNAKDAFAKAIYDRLFSWVVEGINSLMEPPEDSGQNVIGVLDIYGFEIFQTNSFEQLCINYCNEKLQQLFIELVLKQQQLEYQQEGLPWVHIDYFDNREICNLVDSNHTGIVAMLDEACFSRLSEELLLECLSKNLASHPHFTCRKLSPSEKSLRFERDFRIVHYAGEVTYDIEGFLSKNTDPLFQDFKRLMYSSEDANIKHMWQDGSHCITMVTKRPLTTATKFKNAILNLINNLSSKEPYYVRCIKPNDDKVPSFLNKERCEHQVRYLGLLENVKVRKAGFAFRMTFQKFLKRYKMIHRQTWPKHEEADDKQAVTLITDTVVQGDDDDDEVVIAKTKVFIKSARTVKRLEKRRLKMMPYICILMQKVWRGKAARIKVKKMRAAMTIEHCYQHYLAKKYLHQLVQQQKDTRGRLQLPPSPHFITPIFSFLQKIADRWFVHLTILKIAPEEREAIRLKVYAGEALKQKRKEWGSNRKWVANYLYNDITCDQRAESAFESLRKKESFNDILFLCRIVKTNKFFKSERRMLLVTEDSIYRTDCNKFKLIKKPTKLRELTGVSVTPDKDQLIIMHLEGGTDMIIAISDEYEVDMVGELVGVLCSAYTKKVKKDLRVVVNKTPPCMLNDVSRQVSVKFTAANQEAVFHKVDDQIVLDWPRH